MVTGLQLSLKYLIIYFQQQKESQIGLEQVKDESIMTEFQIFLWKLNLEKWNNWEKKSLIIIVTKVCCNVVLQKHAGHE